MTAGALGGVSTGETVFGHASDKPDRNPKDNSAKEEAKQTALQVQKAASDQHKAKLKKLKNRLDLLKYVVLSPYVLLGFFRPFTIPFSCL